RELLSKYDFPGDDTPIIKGSAKLALVRAGIGAALIPAAASMLHFEGVVYLPVRTTPAKPVELWFAYRKDNDNPAFNALKDVLRGTLAAGR
ncbi:LysR substrate-binding domain-containing protein, partial [Ralstonia pseudosolanacearum]|uniref:LysR substrate-binding domain-containing protein n=1 Tax=Ralstonia pseudosolanacearum TaxID=1310165 RepID=UPI003D172435